MELFLRTSQTSAEPLNLRLALPLCCGRKGNGHGESLHKGQDATFGEKKCSGNRIFKIFALSQKHLGHTALVLIKGHIKGQIGCLTEKSINNQ